MVSNIKHRKVSVSLTSKTIKKIDEQLKAIRKETPGSRPTRSSVCDQMIRRELMRKANREDDKTEAIEFILSEISEIQGKIQKANKKGRTTEANSLYLLAASKELEILSLMSSRNEHDIKTTLIQTIQFIKKGTGYKNLPNIPVSDVNLSS